MKKRTPRETIYVKGVSFLKNWGAASVREGGGVITEFIM